MDFTELQKKIFIEALAVGGKNLIVEAVAGSGKTTTIKRIIEILPESSSKLYIAFNRSIVKEMQKKMDNIKNIEIKTCHSLGFTALKNARLKSVKLENRKYNTIMRDVVISGENIEHLNLKDQNSIIYKKLEYFNFIFKKTMYCKNFALYHDDVDFDDKFDNLVHRVIKDSIMAMSKQNKLREDEIAEVIREAKEGMSENRDKYKKYILSILKKGIEEEQIIDYADMLYMACRLKGKLFKYDYVFVDECQDLNQLQINLIKKINTDKIIFVGDPCQAIYGFAGALNNSFEIIESEFNCKKMPLSETFRCPKNVIDFVNKYYTKSNIYTNKEEETGIKRIKEIDPNILKNDLILCFRNAPLLDLFVELILRGKPCKINKSKEFFDEFFSFLKVQFFLKYISIKNVDKVFSIKVANAENNDEIERLLDLKLIVLKFMELTGNCSKEDYVEQIKKVLKEQMEKSRKAQLVLSTIHRAKGLEADSVIILEFDKLLYFAQAGIGQSDNLLYVALTRTKDKLTLQF